MKNLYALLLIIFSVNFLIQCDPIFPPPPNLEVGDTLWIHHLPQGDVMHYAGEEPLAVGSDGTLYYEAGGHGWNGTNWDPVQIYAINKANGSLKWKSEPLATWHINGESLMVGDEGNIYVASAYKLYSLNPCDGSFNWVWEVPKTLPNPNGSAPLWTYGELGYMALTNGNDIVIKTMGSGVYQRAYYCISSDGSIKWIQLNVSSSNSHISVGKDGMIYDVTTIDNTYVLTARDPGTGELSWYLPVQINESSNNISFTDGGDIIAFISRDTLVRISTTSHRIIWKVAAGNSAVWKLIAPNGNIYVYNQWKGWSIYNSSYGSQVNSELGISGEPLIFDNKTQIYATVSDWHPYLHVTDKVGNEIWRSQIQASAHTITVSDNVVYFWASDNGEQAVFALQTDASLAHSGWPRFTHDNRNTFNFNKW